jgi:hypothetical protein
MLELPITRPPSQQMQTTAPQRLRSPTNIAWTIPSTMAIINPDWTQQPSGDGAEQFSSMVPYCDASGVL